MSAIRMGAVNVPMIPRSQSVFQVRGAGRDALGAGIIRLALPLEAIVDLHVYFSQTYDAPPELESHRARAGHQVQTKAHDQGLFSYRPAQDRDDLASEPIFFST